MGSRWHIAWLRVRRQVAFVAVAVLVCFENPQLEGHGPLFLATHGSAHTHFVRDKKTRQRE
jgi:hypothetical protein